jgi:hypothetical protein
MPVIEDGELDRHGTTSASFNTSSTLLDLLPKIERPFRVRSRSVQDRSNIVFEDN